MVKFCIVKGCLNSYNSRKSMKKGPSVSFFQPTTPVRLQRWSDSMGIRLKESDYVCQYHFSDKDIKLYDKIVVGNTVQLIHTLKKTLREEALPTVEHQFKFDPKQIKLKRIKKPAKGPIALLKQKLSVLPQYWLYRDKPNKIEFMRFDPTSKQFKKHIVLNEDISVSVICSNNVKVNLEKKLSSPDEIFEYLKKVEKWPLCVGTLIDKQRYSNECKGVIFGDDAYQNTQRNPRCKSCRVLRHRLNAQS